MTFRQDNNNKNKNNWLKKIMPQPSYNGVDLHTIKSDTIKFLCLNEKTPFYVNFSIFIFTELLLCITYNIPFSYYPGIFEGIRELIGMPLFPFIAVFLNFMMIIDFCNLSHKHRKDRFLTKLSAAYIDSISTFKLFEILRILCFTIIFTLIGSFLTYFPILPEKYFDHLLGIPCIITFLYLIFSIVLTRTAFTIFTKKYKYKQVAHLFRILSDSLLLVILLYMCYNVLSLATLRITLPTYLQWSYYLFAFSTILTFLLNFWAILNHIANCYVYDKTQISVAIANYTSDLNEISCGPLVSFLIYFISLIVHAHF